MTEVKPAKEWTPEEIAEINAEMADCIIHECIETLKRFPCLHGASNEVSPPMMLAEGIRCTVAHFAQQAASDRAALASAEAHADKVDAELSLACVALVSERKLRRELQEALTEIQVWLLDSMPVTGDGIWHPLFVKASNATKAALAHAEHHDAETGKEESK